MKKISVIIIALNIFTHPLFAATCPNPNQFQFIDRSKYDPDPFYSEVKYEILPPKGWAVLSIQSPHRIDQLLSSDTSLQFDGAEYIIKDTPGADYLHHSGLICSYTNENEVENRAYPHTDNKSRIKIVPSVDHYQENNFINLPNWQLREDNGVYHSIPWSYKFYTCNAKQIGDCFFNFLVR